MEINTTVMLGALRRHYDQTHVVLAEVPDRTGFANGRVDALAVSLHPSTKLALIGFEFKVARGDWLRELKNNEKSGRFREYCSQWYLVTPPGIAQRKEIPVGWGHITVRELPPHLGTFDLKISKSARRNPKPVKPDDSFWTALLRYAVRASPAGVEFEMGVAEGRRRERAEQWRENADLALLARKRRFDKLAAETDKSLKEFAALCEQTTEEFKKSLEEDETPNDGPLLPSVLGLLSATDDDEHSEHPGDGAGDKVEG